MKKRIVSLLLALALLVLPVLPAFAAEEDPYTYVALGDSITTGVGLKDTHFSSTAKSYDVQENYHGYSKDCYVARVADALGLDRDHAVNYGMPADGHHARAESPDPPDPEKEPGKPGPDPGRVEGRPEAAGFRHGGDL